MIMQNYTKDTLNFATVGCDKRQSERGWMSGSDNLVIIVYCLLSLFIHFINKLIKTI